MIGQKIVYLESVDSTNNYIARLIKADQITNGTAIMAENQTNGVGQRGTNWQSVANKNLTISYYIEHNSFPIKNSEALTHFTSLAIINLLKSYNIEAKIKWPNDIVVESSKIAGILIENQLISSNFKNSIIGIGLNVNQENFGDYNATSIKNITKRNLSIHEVAVELSKNLTFYYKYISDKKFTELKDIYLENLWLKNIPSRFEKENGEQFIGIIKGTNEIGQLIIEINNEPISFDLKTIKFIERNNPTIF